MQNAECRVQNGGRSGRLLFCILHSAFCIFFTGCAAVGVAARALPPPTIQPSYTGLRDQNAAVMVWADRAIRIDFPTLQLDVAGSVQNRLSKAKELSKTTWPVAPESIVRFQQDHPEIEALPITDVAPRLSVSRLIYIEIEDLRTRSEASLELYRGVISATISVVEISGGKAKVAYTENDVRAVFPPKSPPEGVLNANDYRIYLGTLDAFTTQIANRFLPHADEE